ncbi:MAG: single-stranded DNA-binding protein [Minicystis sp.]
MSEGLNRVMLFGNLGADPELRFTAGGQPVLNLRLATTESYLDRDQVRRERTDWHNVVVWGKRGEALAKLLAKGLSVFIEGPLRTSSYDDREGNKRYKTEVVANNVVLAGRGRGDGMSVEGAGDVQAGGATEMQNGGASEAPVQSLRVRPEAASKPNSSAMPVASAQELDGLQGNPTVKFVPARWSGEDFRGKPYSDCTPEFLDVLASALQWSADNPQEGKGRFVEWNRKDAARARGWAARLRSRGAGSEGRAGAGDQGGGNRDLEGGSGGAEDEIPF